MRRRRLNRRNPSKPTKAQLEKTVLKLADDYLWQLIYSRAIDPDAGLRFEPREFGLAGYGIPSMWSRDGENHWEESIDIFTDGGAHAVDEDGNWVGWDLRFLK